MGEGGRCEDGSGRRNGRGDQKKVQRNGGAQGSQGSREDGWMFEPRCFFSSFGSRESRSGCLCVALSWTGSLRYRSANRPVSTSQSQRRVTDWGCDSDGRKRRNEDSMHVLQRFWRRSHHSHHTPLERGGIPGGTHRWVFVLSRCATPCFVPRYPLLNSGWLRSVRSVGRFCAWTEEEGGLRQPEGRQR
jgi:hypothetical protein